MDEQLAAIYGTGMDEEDLEKTAAAELLVKLAEEQGVNLDDFSDEEVGEMLNDLYANEGIVHTAQAEDAEWQEKFAEADYLGRIMAHSMVQELNNIEKEAKFNPRKLLAQAGEATGIGDIVSGLRAKSQAKKLYGKGAKLMKENPMSGKAQEYFRQSSAVGSGAGEALREGGKRFGKRVAAPAGAAAALGGGAYALGKKKQSSALESLAEQRAYELAAEAGYIKEASVDYEIERRALEICEENGIPVDWNE